METTNLIHEVARLGLSTLATVLALLVTYYTPRIFRALETRLGVDLPDPLEAEAERLALQAIAFAEERGRAAAKELGKRVLSSEKLDMAAAYFRDHASAQVMTWVNGRVTEWIESKLGLLRLAEPAKPAILELAAAAPDPSTPGAQ